jgi:hypothetical protein
MKKRKCEQCKKEFLGRSDKRFCSLTCKNKFNYDVKKKTKDYAKGIDKILHRNRVILQTLMGEKRKKMMIDRLELEETGFNFTYMTRTYLNSLGKRYYYVYDFAWMEFSTQEILIVQYGYKASKKSPL